MKQFYVVTDCDEEYARAFGSEVTATEVASLLDREEPWGALHRIFTSDYWQELPR